MKLTWVRTIVGLFIFVVGYLLYCYLSVIPIYRDVYRALLNGSTSSTRINDKIKDSFVHRYGESSGTIRKVSLVVLFTANNVVDSGVIYMIYSITVKDLDGKMVGGAQRVPITLLINRVNGHWVVEKKYERP